MKRTCPRHGLRAMKTREALVIVGHPALDQFARPKESSSFCVADPFLTIMCCVVCLWHVSGPPAQLDRLPCISLSWKAWVASCHAHYIHLVCWWQELFETMHALWRMQGSVACSSRQQQPSPAAAAMLCGTSAALPSGNRCNTMYALWELGLLA